jgi:hypothetical protein
MKKKITALQYLKAAKSQYDKDGEIEVDIPTLPAKQEKLISRGSDPGAYVRAWVWVYDTNAEQETRDL